MGTRQCTTGVRNGRLAKAQGFLQAADDTDLLDDTGQLGDAVVTLYVHAGIAASDVICCARLGKYPSAENHAEAINLLKTADASSTTHLATLLSMKTKAGYSHTAASSTEIKKPARAATHLVEKAHSIAPDQA